MTSRPMGQNTGKAYSNSICRFGNRTTPIRQSQKKDAKILRPLKEVETWSSKTPKVPPPVSGPCHTPVVTLGSTGRVGKGLDLKREGPGATKITIAEEGKTSDFQYYLP